MTLTAHQKVAMLIGSYAIQIIEKESENEQLKAEIERLKANAAEKSSEKDNPHTGDLSGSTVPAGNSDPAT